MKWRVCVFTVTFLMLHHYVMSYRHRCYGDWRCNFHNQDFSIKKDSFLGHGISKEVDFANLPDFSETYSSKFLSYHPFPSSIRDTVTSTEKGLNIKGTKATFTFEPSHQHHHMHNYQYRNREAHKDVYETITTTGSTSTKESTLTTTDPTSKFATDPRYKRTVEPKVESTTRQIIKSTTTQFITETTTDSTRDFLNCLRFCPVTSEYNPVCGTNLVTYTNPGRLICAKSCGLTVEILRTSPCPANTIQILPTTQSPSTMTTTAITDPKTTSEILTQQQCTNSCDRSNEWRPVCGSNGLTYNNGLDLLCAQYCGIDVRIKKFSACTDINPNSTTSTTARSVGTVSSFGSNSILSPDTQSCLRNCSVTSEHVPICGTNDVTYKNPCSLQCLITCGINVQMKHMSSCVNKDNGNNNKHQTPSTNSVPVQVTPSLPPHVSLCMKVCPILAEVKPICGTNGVTYKNPSQLQCAKTCGVDVQIKHRQACPQENNKDIEISSVSNPQPVTIPSTFNQEACIEACNTDSVYTPVCGSNDVTYRNIQHLQCAQSCHVEVSLKTFLPCTQSSSTEEITPIGNIENVVTTSATNAPEISEEPPVLYSTIEPDRLSMVFNIPTTTKSQEDDIDPRFNVSV